MNKFSKLVNNKIFFASLNFALVLIQILLTDGPPGGL